jgi:hypothetical protein
MALALPLNTFLSRPVTLTTTEQVVYTTPEGISAIVLSAQASNVTTSPVTISFNFIKNNVSYFLLKEFTILPNDAADLINGKLIVEQGSSLKVVVSAVDSVDLVLSILETSNE